MSKHQSAVIILCACVALLGALACDSRTRGTTRTEGVLPGECSDGADNDADGAFDCSDSDCAGAPSCAGSDGGVSGQDGGVASTVFPERDWVCAAGESPPCGTTEPAHTDGERTALARAGLGATYLFVFDTVSIPAPVGGAAPGFNLDGLDSGGGSEDSFANCEELAPDLRSPFDPDHVGVDNAFADLIPTMESILTPEDCPGGVTDGCIDALLQQQINEGTMLLLVELGGVDDVEYDASVTVQLYSGTVAGGGPPSLAGSTLAPGQSFQLTPLGAAIDGDIFAGRARVVGVTLPLPVAFGDGATIPLTLLDAEIRFDVAAGRITGGHLGGSLDIDQIVVAVEAAMPGYGDPMRSVLESVADIAPSSSDPTICDRVGMGLTFRGIEAVSQ